LDLTRAPAWFFDQLADAAHQVALAAGTAVAALAVWLIIYLRISVPADDPLSAAAHGHMPPGIRWLCACTWPRCPGQILLADLPPAHLQAMFISIARRQAGRAGGSLRNPGAGNSERESRAEHRHPRRGTLLAVPLPVPNYPGAPPGRTAGGWRAGC
jgi:hypothetical protein